jgi:hypothetical protein
VGATVQTLYQYDDATCLQNCTGDAQVQDAVQTTATDQRANASTSGQAAPVDATKAPAPVAGPPAPTPPASLPPAAPPAPPAPAAATPPSPWPHPKQKKHRGSAARIASTAPSHLIVDAVWTVERPAPPRDTAATAPAALPPGHDVVADPVAPPPAQAATPKHTRGPLIELPALRRAALQAIGPQPGQGPDGAWLAAGLGLLAVLLLARTARRRTV